MPLPRIVTGVLTAGIMAFGVGTVSGQSYPNKPVRMVTGPAGGGADLVTRLIAQGISGPLGQQVIVDNRGGGGVVAGAVAKAPPDGYTLIMFGSVLWLAPFMLEKTPYDPLKDFAPVTLAVSSPNLLVVHPSLPVKSVKELIALARARPGQINFASGSIGSAAHLAGELFRTMARVDIVHILYKGAGPALTDLLGGHVQVMFASTPAATQYQKSGRLRVLAITTLEPSALAPDLPTISAAGLPGFESTGIFGLFAPAGTPATAIGRLNQETVRYVNLAEAKERFSRAGIEIIGSTPEQLAAAVKSEMDRFGKIIRDASANEK